MVKGKLSLARLLRRKSRASRRLENDVHRSIFWQISICLLLSFQDLRRSINMSIKGVIRTVHSCSFVHVWATVKGDKPKATWFWRGNSKLGRAFWIFEVPSLTRPVEDEESVTWYFGIFWFFFLCAWLFFISRRFKVCPIIWPEHEMWLISLLQDWHFVHGAEQFGLLTFCFCFSLFFFLIFN